VLVLPLVLPLVLLVRILLVRPLLLLLCVPRLTTRSCSCQQILRRWALQER